MKPISASSVWPTHRPALGARRMIASGIAELLREGAHLALDEVGERQQVDAAVAVLGEVAHRQLRAVAGAGDEVVQAVGDVVERRHPQPRLQVRERHARARIVVRLFAVNRRGQRVERRLERRDQRVVGAAQIDPHDRRAEVRGDEHRVALVLGIAVARHDHGDDGAGRGELRETQHHGRIDAAAQPDREAPGARLVHAFAHPARGALGSAHGGHSITRRRTVRRARRASGRGQRPIASAAGDSGHTGFGAAT